MRGHGVSRYLARWVRAIGRFDETHKKLQRPIIGGWRRRFKRLHLRCRCGLPTLRFMTIRVLVTILCLAGCAPKSTNSAGILFAGEYALNWPVLTADACGGGCDPNAYWARAPTWSVKRGTAAYTVEVDSSEIDADVAGDAVNFAIEVPITTPGCSGDAVYMVTLAPENTGCQVDLQARFAVRCAGVLRVCACSYSITGSRSFE